MGVSRTQIVRFIKKGEKGDKGAVMRGPQAWSDCAVGYGFQAGGSTDDYLDVIMYGNYYYNCIKSHTKTASNYPGSTADINNAYWQLGDSVALIATRVLLAENAVIAGWTFANNRLQSSDGNTYLDGINGVVVAKKGIFAGNVELPFTAIETAYPSNAANGYFSINKDYCYLLIDLTYLNYYVDYNVYVNVPMATAYNGVVYRFYISPTIVKMSSGVRFHIQNHSARFEDPGDITADGVYNGNMIQFDVSGAAGFIEMVAVPYSNGVKWVITQCTLGISGRVRS